MSRSKSPRIGDMLLIWGEKYPIIKVGSVQRGWLAWTSTTAPPLRFTNLHIITLLLHRVGGNSRSKKSHHETYLWTRVTMQENRIKGETSNWTHIKNRLSYMQTLCLSLSRVIFLSQVHALAYWSAIPCACVWYNKRKTIVVFHH